MPKNIIFLNPESHIDAFFDFFDELKKHSFAIKLLSEDASLIKKFNENSWTAKKLFFWPKISSLPSFLLVVVLSPLIVPILFALLSFLKFKKNINTVVCFSYFDKIFTTTIAKILKIKIIWLMYPDLQYIKINRLIGFMAKKCSKKVLLITLTKSCKDRLLAEKYSENSIHTISPAIKILDPHQENMFEKMAINDKRKQQKKFFTIGTISDLNEENNLETILNSITKILTVTPNLQFIIIGEGKERKKLNWLCKKMGIENLVWFVGQQKHLKKWFENFDLYIVSSSKKTIADINNSLKAMNSSLPVLAEDNDVWSEIIKNNHSGILLEKFDSEAIAQEIIRLKQNSPLRNKLGQQAEEQINRHHTVKEMVDKFINIV